MNEQADPLVSVILPVLDGAETIEHAIDSIRAQTYRNWELIVVDDCSSDRTPETIQKIASADVRIRIFRNEKRVGLAGALNVGFAQARGDLIARLDCDDESLPERLEIQVEAFIREPALSILGCGAMLRFPNGIEQGVVRPLEEHAALCLRIYRDNPFVHPTVMMRREVLERIGGYDTVFRYAQDYELWLRAHRTCHFRNLPIPLIRYTVRDRFGWSRWYWSSRARFRWANRDRAMTAAAWYSARELLAVCRQSLLGRPFGYSRALEERPSQI